MKLMSVVQRFEGRSLFWPLVLIGVGVVWLLSNMGVLQPASISVLFRLWPLILIIIGLDILFGRRSSTLSTLIGLGGVALIILLMLVGPSLGWASSAEVKTAQFSEPVGDAAAATVVLDLSVGSTDVHALPDSRSLFEADLRYIGEVQFNVRGETTKTITLSQKDNTPQTINFWDFGFFNSSDQNLRWNIGLTPDVPINLTVNSGVSSSTLDLNGLKLTNLDINNGVGSLSLTLPAMDDSYNVSISGGTGSTSISVAEGAAIHFDIDGGVGSVTIDLPDNAAVRIDASTGLGSVNLPSNYVRQGGSDENFVGEDGVWQTAGFDRAEHQIFIDYNGGVGSFNVR
jgi:hypothetical protein